MKSISTSVYFRFAKLLGELQASKTGVQVDPIEGEILHAVLLRTHEGGKLLSSEIRIRQDIASPATIQNRVARLLKRGLLRSEIGVDDARKRLLFLTAESLRYFNEFGECVVKASKK